MNVPALSMVPLSVLPELPAVRRVEREGLVSFPVPLPMVPPFHVVLAGRERLVLEVTFTVLLMLRFPAPENAAAALNVWVPPVSETAPPESITNEPVCVPPTPSVSTLL